MRGCAGSGWVGTACWEWFLLCVAVRAVLWWVRFGLCWLRGYAEEGKGKGGVGGGGGIVELYLLGCSLLGNFLGAQAIQHLCNIDICCCFGSGRCKQVASFYSVVIFPQALPVRLTASF